MAFVFVTTNIVIFRTGLATHVRLTGKQSEALFPRIGVFLRLFLTPFVYCVSSN